MDAKNMPCVSPNRAPAEHRDLLLATRDAGGLSQEV
jgi:hypothetical protein